MADEELTQGQGQEPKTYSQEEVDKLLAEKDALNQEEKNQLAGKLRAEFKDKELKAAEKAKKDAEFAKMSELEQQRTLAKEATEELQKLKDQIALSQQKEETRKLMQEKGLPEIFLDNLIVFKDAEATKANIEKAKLDFDTAVQKALGEKVKTHVPTNDVQTGNKDSFGLSHEERLKALGLPKGI